MNLGSLKFHFGDALAFLSAKYGTLDPVAGYAQRASSSSSSFINRTLCEYIAIGRHCYLNY